MPEPFSIEAVILGRNDEYEPNWTENLYAVIAYNRALFEGSAVDFRVAFVEWNPPEGKPLLSPGLLDRYPFLRAIVVDREVHRALSAVRDLPMMVNFGFNAAFRTTAADFTMTTCGDDLWSTRLAKRICEEGLQPSRLYRAERANVKRDLHFTGISPQALERPENILFVDTCTKPPYDVPPYTNACGDFSLTDSGTMFAFGGMDESIREARLHLDSRLCINAMTVVEECILLGQIYHITHSTSWTVKKRVKGRQYVWDDAMPYINPPDWGLADFTWERENDRYYHVSLPKPGAARSVPESLPSEARVRAEAVRDCLLQIRESVHPEHPVAPTRSLSDALDLWTVAASPTWDSSIQRRDDELHIETSPVQWSPAVLFPFKRSVGAETDNWHWTRVLVRVTEGALAIAVADQSLRVLAERYVYSGGDEEIFVPTSSAARHVLIRNIDDANNRSLANVRALELVTHSKNGGAAV